MNNELLQKAKNRVLKLIIEGIDTLPLANAYLSLCQAEQTEVYTQLQAAQEPLQMEMQQAQDD